MTKHFLSYLHHQSLGAFLIATWPTLYLIDLVDLTHTYLFYLIEYA